MVAPLEALARVFERHGHEKQAKELRRKVEKFKKAGVPDEIPGVSVVILDQQELEEETRQFRELLAQDREKRPRPEPPSVNIDIQKKLLETLAAHAPKGGDQHSLDLSIAQAINTALESNLDDSIHLASLEIPIMHDSGILPELHELVKQTDESVRGRHNAIISAYRRADYQTVGQIRNNPPEFVRNVGPRSIAYMQAMISPKPQ